MSRILDVYLTSKMAGKLIQEDSGEMTFSYDQEFFQTASHGISLSMPFPVSQSEGDEATYKGPKVKAFFSGLLPDESVRDRLAAYLGLSERNPFALLEAVGGDCAGALALHPEGQTPPEVSKQEEALDDVKLKEILDLIKRRPMLAGDDGYRLSLAGAQDKLAVGYDRGNVILIKGGMPTTHILKPIIERVDDSAHNELFCMKLANRMNIEVPNAALHYVGETPYYLVERYDRAIQEDGSVTRIHQEDFCQALGIAPEIKYEREGGPNIAACLETLVAYAARPAVDYIKLLDRVIFNFLIGNADAHGKNFSLLYKIPKPELAPAYDLMSTAVYPDLSIKMAMKIGGEYKPSDVYLRHFHKIVTGSKAAENALEKQIQSMTEKIAIEANSLKDELKQAGLVSDVFDSIINVIRSRSNQLNR